MRLAWVAGILLVFGIWAVCARAAGPVFSDHRLTLNGLGPLKLGMEVAKLSPAVRSRFTENGAVGSDCYYMTTTSTEAEDHGFTMLIFQGRIATIGTNDPAYRTAAGSHVGDTTDALQTVYGGKLEKRDAPTGYDLLLKRADGSREFSFFIGESGKVEGLGVGLIPQIDWYDG